MSACRHGVVLVLTLIAIFALEATALGIYLIARTELQLATAGVTHARLRAAVERAVDDAIDVIGIEEYLALTPGTPRTLVNPRASEDAKIELSLERLAHGYLMVRAQASDRRTAASAHATAVVRFIEPALLMAALPGALTTALPAALGAGTAGSIEPCTAAATTLDEFPLFHPARALAPPVPPRLPLGRALPVDSAQLAAHADVTATGAVTAAGPAFVFVTGNADLLSDFTGLLIVAGDLRIGPGASVRGFVIVTGNLRLDEGARMRGLARALAATGHLDGVDYDACALADALRAPALNRPYRPVGHWRIPGL